VANVNDRGAEGKPWHDLGPPHRSLERPDNSGTRLARGIYFVRVNDGRSVTSAKVALLD